MKKKLKWAALILFALFLLLQLTNPPRTNPPVKNDFLTTLNPPAPIAAQFRASCYDCHSTETYWPWYAHIAPVSWLVASDVNNGRYNLNLSAWPGDPQRAARRLEDMSDELGYETMPPKKYTVIHTRARLTESQRKTLIDWLDATAEKLKSSAQ